jgi:hypothetical protein
MMGGSFHRFILRTVRNPTQVRPTLLHKLPKLLHVTYKVDFPSDEGLMWYEVLVFIMIRGNHIHTFSELDRKTHML